MTTDSVANLTEQNSVPSAKRPRAAAVSMNRLRNEVLIALALAFAVEMTGRIIHARFEVSPLLVDTTSLIALLLLCGSGLYLILWLRDAPMLKWLMSLAAVFLVLSQIIDMTEEIPAVAAVGMFGAWHNQVERALLLGGLVLMIATLYVALFQTVGIKQALLKEQADLRDEIAERERARTALNDSRDQLRRLSAHMENLRENERAAVAREIHDELGQTLTSLKIELSSLKNHCGRHGHGSDTEIAEIVESMSEQINGTMQVVRRIITELRPGILDDLGIVAAVEWQARDFEKRTGIECEAVTDGGDIALGREKATAVFRILQEALTNVARHAHASRVTVEMRADAGKLRLAVADDGRGMDPAAARATPSFGLLGMRERAGQFGGDVQINSQRGAGTSVLLLMPLEDTEPASSAP
jgi:signal transduction histidine kinase